MKKSIAGLTLLLVSLSACGDSGGSSGGLSSEDKEAASAISAAIVEAGTDGGSFTADPDEADCIAEGMVRDVGTDQLVEYGLLTEDLDATSSLDSVKMSEGDAEATADVLMECVDVPALLDDMMGAEEIPAEVQACLEEALTEDTIHSMLVLSLSGSEDEIAEEITAPIMECVMAG